MRRNIPEAATRPTSLPESSHSSAGRKRSTGIVLILTLKSVQLIVCVFFSSGCYGSLWVDCISQEQKQHRNGVDTWKVPFRPEREQRERC